MDGAPLTRWRWRTRGALMWPTFIVLTMLDGVIANRLPVFADHVGFLVGWLLSFIATLIAIVIFAPPLGWLLRRWRGDLPKVVARDYAWRIVCVAMTLVFLTAGLANHANLVTDQAALRNATADAEAYIGDHAPRQFMANLHRLDTYPMQVPRIYRICVRNTAGNRDYCVVVDLSKPFGRNVSPAGSEPNSLLSAGTS